MTPEQILAVVFAVAIGVTLGAMGSGGSILTIPVLVYVAGVAPANAVAMSLAIIGVTSAAAAFLYYREGNIHFKAIVLLGVTGVVGAYAGTRLTRLVAESTLMLLFAVLMLIVGSLMFRGGAKGMTPGQCRPLRCALIGALVGAITGFLGVGGGFLIVPALVMFAGLELKTAAGTSLAIIALNSAAGLFGQSQSAEIQWTLAATFTAAALAGMVMGVVAVRRADAATLNRAFAALLIVAGLLIGGIQLAA